MMLPNKPAPNADRKAIPIFGLGQQQRSPFVSTTKRINCVVEMTDNGRQQATILGLPGLQTFIELGDIPARAIFALDDELTFYVVTGDQIIRAALNQSPVLIGSLTTDTGLVWIDSNGKQLFINDGVTAFILTLSTGLLTQISDPDYPIGARGGTFLGQRFFVYTPSTATIPGRVYASDALDGFSWDSLNFFTPESVPDGIIAITRWFTDLIIFGHNSIEWWSSAPTTVVGGLGYLPITGANTQVGLEAEQGFANTNQSLYFVGHGNGQVGVYQVDGYTATKISPPAIDDELAKHPTHFIAVSTAYMVGGHSIYQITLPSENESDAVTIIYDTLSGLWATRKSFGKPYYRGLLSTSNGGSIYISDAFVGRISKMVESEYTENGDPMIFEVTSMHMLKEGDMLAVDQVQIDVEAGQGTSSGPGSDPQAIIQISKDGGHTWGAERCVPMGKVGEYKRRAVRRRIGGSRDIAIRFRITDPVPRRVTGAYLKLTGGVS